MTKVIRMRKPLPSRREFVSHLARNAQLAGGILLVSLGIGVLGYHFFAQLQWLDSLVNASMILGGMGPVDPVRSTGGKWFESLYALFSGVAFLTSVSVFLAPLAHRFLHRFHLETRGEGPDES